MSETMDETLAAARKAGVGSQAHALLGCDWGRAIGSTSDNTPCPLAAEEKRALHHDGQVRYVQLCARHLAVVDRESEPHAPCGKPGCPGCGAGATDVG